MRFKLIPVSLLLCALAAVGLPAMTSHAAADELKLEAQLIWGTNDKKPQNPNLQPVSAELAKRLKESPFKWDTYYLVRKKKFSVNEQEEKSVEMSRQCQIKVKNLGDSQVRLELIGRGKSVGQITQSLPKGHLLVTGGNAADRTAWFVVLQQAD